MSTEDCYEHYTNKFLDEITELSQISNKKRKSEFKQKLGSKLHSLLNILYTVNQRNIVELINSPSYGGSSYLDDIDIDNYEIDSDYEGSTNQINILPEKLRYLIQEHSSNDEDKDKSSITLDSDDDKDGLINSTEIDLTSPIELKKRKFWKDDDSVSSGEDNDYTDADSTNGDFDDILKCKVRVNYLTSSNELICKKIEKDTPKQYFRYNNYQYGEPCNGIIISSDCNMCMEHDMDPYRSDLRMIDQCPIELESKIINGFNDDNGDSDSDDLKSKSITRTYKRKKHNRKMYLVCQETKEVYSLDNRDIVVGYVNENDKIILSKQKNKTSTGNEDNIDVT